MSNLVNKTITLIPRYLIPLLPLYLFIHNHIKPQPKEKDQHIRTHHDPPAYLPVFLGKVMDDVNQYETKN